MLLAPVVSDRKGEHARAARGPRGAGLRARAHRRAIHEMDGAADARPEDGSTPSRRWSTACASAPTSRSASPNPSRPRCASPTAGAARLPRRAGARGARVLQPPRLPGLRLQRAAARAASCSRSTIPPAPARPATASARRSSSIRSAWSLHPHLSLAGGAVRGWDRRNEHYFQMIQALARHYDFDVETPWTELPEHVQHVLLYGSGDEADRVPLRASAGAQARAQHPFEGILPNLERRYRETESPTVREELAQVPRRCALPGVRRHATEPRGALRVRRRPQRCPRSRT